MKLEFSLLGDGTNVQVKLLETLGVTETVKDRFYTSDHEIKFEGTSRGPSVFLAQVTFENLEELLSKPIIGGSLGHLHPYWSEREGVRKRRLQNLESH